MILTQLVICPAINGHEQQNQKGDNMWKKQLKKSFSAKVSLSLQHHRSVFKCNSYGHFVAITFTIHGGWQTQLFRALSASDAATATIPPRE